MSNLELTQTPCGQDCKDCGHYRKNCKGCMMTAGVPFWVEHTPFDICPIFTCCTTDKKHEHCGECSEYPCKTYMDLRDPSFSDEEWEQSVADRKANLIRRKLESKPFTS